MEIGDAFGKGWRRARGETLGEVDGQEVTKSGGGGEQSVAGLKRKNGREPRRAFGVMFRGR